MYTKRPTTRSVNSVRVIKLPQIDSSADPTSKYMCKLNYKQGNAAAESATISGMAD